MRALRGAASVAVASALVVAALPASTAHAAPPSAPYSAFTLDGGDSTAVINGTETYEASTANYFYFGPNGDSTVPDNVIVIANNGGRQGAATLVPPTGTTWNVGQTYETRRFPTESNQAMFDVSGEHGCNDMDGALTIKEIAREAGTGKVTKFAASFKASCGTVPLAVSGEIRFNSSIGYVGASNDKTLLDFGTVAHETTSAPQTVRFTSTGSDPITFGAATFAGAAPAAFAVGADTCSNSSVANGQSCTVQVTASPTAAGRQTANLVLPANTASGIKVVRLTVEGKDTRSLTASPERLDFGPVDPDVDGAPLKVTLTASGTKPVVLGTPSIGGATPGVYRITGDTCAGKTLAVGQRCDITVTPHPTQDGYAEASLLVPNDGLTNPQAIQLVLNGQMTPRGTFYPLPPSRVLDTRTGLGASKAPIGANRAIALQVTGRGGVPSTGVSAVVLNVTATQPTSSSYLTVYPSGVAVRPTASSLNFPKAWTGANSVTVAVGAGGKVDIYNAKGAVHVVADITGYYAADNRIENHGWTQGGAYHPISPWRLFDSRSDWGEPLDGGSYVNIGARWNRPEIDDHIRAFAVNITAVRPSKTGYLTAWNGDYWSQPETSTLNYTPGKVVPNLAIIPTIKCYDCGPIEGWPSIGIYSSATTHVLVDLVGFYDDSTIGGGLRFTPITPTRIADSRTGLGLSGALGA
ncbi:choice-of-anchor D domain-containing protein, partial [Asanoa siamensis]|uniref:choice-of-anchor D domain-containing protein n=1 Tax=Asanoa siamensis TaxID=926357 RepID=UPI0019437627